MKQPVRELHSLRDLVISAAERFPDREFFICEDPKLPSVSGSSLCSLCKKAASVLPADGGSKHIALLGPSSAAWIASYFAVLSAGHVAVPLAYGMTPDELKGCIEQAECCMLLFDEAASDVAKQLSSEIPGLSSRELHDFLDDVQKAPEVPWPDLGYDSPAAMYFTSGTTSKSRCVILTHRNLSSQVNALMSVIPLSEKDTGLSILPLSHTFEAMSNIAGALYCGGTLYINESLRTVKKNLIKCRPTILIVVPLILQTLRKEITREAKKQGRLEAMERALKLNGNLRKIGINAGSLLFKDIHSNFGGRLKTIICGGAALDPDLIYFYRCLGIEVLQGYGITECSPVVSVNTIRANRPGSVGRTIPCCETAVIGGEICVRGDSVSPGYYNDDEANRESYRDGWFHTGDLGYIDKDGYVYCTGRIKNLIVLSNGENVSPEEIEEQLYRLEGVKEALVYESNGMITAEIFADRSVIPDKKAAWDVVGTVNKAVASYKQIGDIVLRDREFDKTSTKKIKRYHSKEGCE